MLLDSSFSRSGRDQLTLKYWDLNCVHRELAVEIARKYLMIHKTLGCGNVCVSVWSHVIMQLLNSSNAVQSCCRWTGPDKFSQCLSICLWPPACSDYSLRQSDSWLMLLS